MLSDLQRLVNGLVLPASFSGQRRRGDGRTAAEGLELGVGDGMRVSGSTPDLKSHHVAFRSAHQTGSNGLFLASRVPILRVLIWSSTF